MRELGEVGSLEFGRIKWYRIDKQYGFVTRENGEELFFHHASIVFTGPGSCNHARAICARAISLIPENKKISLDSAPKDVQHAMENQRIQFRVVKIAHDGAERLEARGVKRA